MNEVNDEASRSSERSVSACIDWYHEGQTRIVEVGGVRVTVRLVGRKGRRARISITAPAGATFDSGDARELARSD
ncbi:MAG: hypothetical protein H6822_22455 [Planctomycetaceae bacterium]|nr:hypothetical protein [Planctomycetales bacterium]MCB9924958.1 hypothetical protein [Planctomycetaceae bacterium]